MKIKKRFLWVLAPLAMTLLILDTTTAIVAASNGITMCLRSVIPSLFPFIVISSYITQELIGRSMPALRPISKLCRIPKGSESLLLIGFLGGYPVGAQCVSDAYLKGALSRNDAERMISLCNNAGPAFMFGIIGGMFSNTLSVWIVWAIHIASALIAGMILPGKAPQVCKIQQRQNVSIMDTVQKTIKITANICAWLVLFRIIIAYADKYILHLLPNNERIIISGFLELANGCFSLQDVADEPVRFIVCSALLSFGGICVSMQTRSVAGSLGCKNYFPGKVIHCCISIVISILLLPLLFHNAKIHLHLLIICSCILLIAIYVIAKSSGKKSIAISKKMIYNDKKSYI